MKDTTPPNEALLRELFAERSGEERLKMGCAMFDDAKKMMLSGISSEMPHASRQELKRVLFLRLYGEELGKEKAEQILSFLLKPR